MMNRPFQSGGPLLLLEILNLIEFLPLALVLMAIWIVCVLLPEKLRKVVR